MKRTRSAYQALSLLAIVLILAGCGGSGEGVSSQVVSGVAATGAPLAGQVKIKDSAILTREKSTVIANDGSFALDVTDMKAPFVLQATGTADGKSYTLHSFADGPGTANINPLTNAAVANAAGISDPAQVYDHPDSVTLQKIKNNLSHTITALQDTLQPLLNNFNADKIDPVTGPYKADHTGLDGMLDNVQITIIDGIITVTNLKTGAVIFTGPISDLKHGHFTENDDDLPNPGAVPTAPTMIMATGGTYQATISWKSVGNALSYNIYWSANAGVTTGNGTKISGGASPYVHTGLSAGTAYYYIVTAVNSAGESPASIQATATTTTSAPPPPTVTNAPTGVMATGGTGQATISWSAVAGATSYNIYWSTTTGVTTGGTKIAGATSPTVQTGLTDGTTYYYIVTAVNSAGESAASVQAAATPITPAPSPTVPSVPTSVTSTGSANQATISWSAVTGATSYNIYWSTTTGVTTTGTKITGTTSPYVHMGLSAGTTYYYIVTAVNSVGESGASTQTGATTNPPAPTVTAAPKGVTATGASKQVTVSWPAVTGATSYNIYWSTTSGVTTASTKITGATRPYVQTGLADSTVYYYIVTAVNSVGESAASAQVTATTSTPAPVLPSAPTGVTATGGAKQVTVSWSAVSGATSYNIYWSTTSGVTTSTGTKILGTASGYVHSGLTDSTAYYYIVTAVNSAGEGTASAPATATTSTPAPAPKTWALHTLYCAGCHGTGKRTATVATVRAAITSNRGNMGMLNSTDCTACHGAGKAGQSALTDAIIADILAGM